MEISDIKSRLTILQVLVHYHLTPDRNPSASSGQSFAINCPWHDDKTPSLQIYPETNTWTCFSSSCDSGSGDVIDFIMRMEGCTKHEAILKAKEHIPNAPSATLSPNNSAPSTTSNDLEKQLARIAVLSKYYRQIEYRKASKRNEPITTYLASRKINIKHVSVGYCYIKRYGEWRRGYPDWYVQIEKYGLKRFSDCAVFAMRNQENQIVSLYGRKIKEDGHYYLNGAHQGLYPHWPSKTSKSLILTESIIDAASIPQYEGRAVLALYGTKAFTKDHASAIAQLSQLEEIILMLDADEAGEKEIPVLISKVQQIKPEVTLSKVSLPTGEDVNSTLVKYGEEYLENKIEDRVLLFSTEKETLQPNTPTQTNKLTSTNPELLHWVSSSIHITVMGGVKVTGLDKLRATLRVTQPQSTQHKIPLRETLDLYNSRAVDQLTSRMCDHYDLTQIETQHIVSDLTTALEDYRTTQLELLHNTKKNTTYQLSADETKESIDFLSKPKLIERTLADIKASGIIGEEQNAIIGHIIYQTRKQPKPLHVMYLGKSGTGKTYLQEMLAQLLPEEDKKNVTALSDQSLYYLGNQIKGKVLFIEDIDGAENVMYVIRELQTKGWVSKTVVWKDPRGNMESKDVTAHGPVCISSCTTHEKIYEDNANRCFLLYIDDSREQDERIMDYQKQRSAGIIRKVEQESIRKKHHNIQRLLKPIEVINPYAMLIDLPPEVFKPRRSLQLLLGFIEAVTFYHQYQREVKKHNDTGTRYIETTLEDIDLSFRLLKPVLFTKSDELTHASRRFFERLKQIIPEGQTFVAGQVRKQLRVTTSTQKRYLRELQYYGYIKVQSGSRYRGYEYQIQDYEEYNQLRSSIEQRLKAILDAVRKALKNSGS